MLVPQRTGSSGGCSLHSNGDCFFDGMALVYLPDRICFVR